MKKHLEYTLFAITIALILSAIFVYRHHEIMKGKVLIKLEIMDQIEGKVLLEQKRKQAILNIDSKDRIELDCGVIEQKRRLSKSDYQKYLNNIVMEMKKRQQDVIIFSQFKWDLNDNKNYYFSQNLTRIYKDENNNAYVFTYLGDSISLEDIWRISSGVWCLANNKPGNEYPDNLCPDDSNIKLLCAINKTGEYSNCYCKRLSLARIKSQTFLR